MIKPWWAEDPDGAESFEREAQLLARVSDPGIVQIFDVGQAEEGLYFVTELVEGESLAVRLKRGGPLAAWEACEIAEQLCRALEHAHAEHIVHRDIKPANVLISARGRVKVGDLGIARLAEGSTDGGTATIVGTPRYMAPEQASGQPVTPATDVYSAGIVLYEMLAGRTPFGGESAVEIALQHVNLEPPPLPDGTPRTLRRVVARALAKDPADRYQSAVAMADALARAREAPAADRTTRRRRARTGGRPRPRFGTRRRRSSRRTRARSRARRDRPDPSRATDEPAPDRESGRAPAHGRGVRARAGGARGRCCSRRARSPRPRRWRSRSSTGSPPAQVAAKLNHGTFTPYSRTSTTGRGPAPRSRRRRPPGAHGQAGLDDQRRAQQGPATGQRAVARRAERDQREPPHSTKPA